MDIALVDMESQRFRRALVKKKRALAPSEFGWYPYGTLNIFHVLSDLLTGDNRDFLSRVGDGLIVDIGAADGDLAFFLESLGYRAHIADFAPTNFNNCRGMRLLKQNFNSSVEILEIDLDSQFKLPADRYELAFFLGILYHLKNPYLALESLAKQARYAFISSRDPVQRRLRRGRVAGQSQPDRIARRAGRLPCRRGRNQWRRDELLDVFGSRAAANTAAQRLGHPRFHDARKCAGFRPCDGAG